LPTVAAPATIGYGDVYAQTLLGKMIASIIMLTGIGIIAMPTGILSSTLTEIIHERRQCGKSTD
jgi:voltage-gated potassium channel